MITPKEFWKGRDTAYAKDLTPEIRWNAEVTLHRVNLLLEEFYRANPTSNQDRGCNSGWRPPALNASIKGAAKMSNHMLARACDVNDDDGMLDKWCMSNVGQDALERIGLWMEHPSATPRWCHLQTVPPRSGRRVFYP